MPISLQSFILGPLQNRTILLSDEESGRSIIIDPAFSARKVLDEMSGKKLSLERILITHAHFDHIGGAAELFHSVNGGVPVHIHPMDLAWWNQAGGAKEFGFHIDASIPVLSDLDIQTTFTLGDSVILVRHTPGHTPGHVIFYIPDLKTACVGDLIFRQGVGRTDLPQGDGTALIHSIDTQILTLPDETILLPGHGPETTVGFERKNNPFL
jgi:glyoxylase-like metal-dependent hydrolase (beta-lactamase superfamily II)